MVRIAVYHHDWMQSQKILQALKNQADACKMGFYICTVQSFAKFSENFAKQKYHFDIICMDTCHPAEAKRVLERGEQKTEFILLDTGVETLRDFMRYKPAAWLETSDMEAGQVADAISVCLHYLRQREDGRFCIRTKTKSIWLPYRRILYLESSRHQVIAHTVEQKNFCAFAGTLDAVEQVLPRAYFLRCHQSFLVNLSHACQLDRTNRRLVLHNGDTVDISKRYYKEVSHAFEDVTFS